MKKHLILALVVSSFIGAFTISGDTGVQRLSASLAPYNYHWANIYTLDNGHGGSYGGYLPARVRETADGGFAIGLTKWQDSASYGAEQMGVIKLDPSGHAQWAISPLESGGDDGICTVKSLAVLSDGRLAVTAKFMDGYDSLDYYIVLMMLRRNGSLQWLKTFLDGDVYDLQAARNGGMLVSGRLKQGPWAARLNSTGRIVWQAQLDAPILSIQSTTDGGFIGAGVSGGEVGQPSSDAWIGKFDALGNIAWQRSLGDPAAADSFSRVVLTGDGYVALGETEGLGASSRDLWVVKFDFRGHVRWQRAFGRQGTDHWDWGAAIVRLHEAGYLLCGNTSDYGFALRLDPSGNLLWGRTYAAQLDDALQTRQGDFVLIGKQFQQGTCYPIGDPNHNYLFIVRVDTLGVIDRGCCVIGVPDIVGRKTVAVPYDTYFSTYHLPASVGSLLPTDSGYVPVTTYHVCPVGSI